MMACASHLRLFLEKSIREQWKTTISNFRDMLLNATENTVVLNKIDALISEFTNTSKDYDSLDALHHTIEGILHEGYQIIDHAISDETRLEKLCSAFESYMMEMTYDIVFFKITEIMIIEDKKISKALEDMEHIDFCQIALPPSIRNERKRVLSAIAIFEKIGSYRTPAEKLDCLLSTIFKLTQDESDHVLDSDALVPLLLMTLIRSKVPHLTANLVYMKDYTFERNIIAGKYGYALITFEGVLDYILTTHLDLMTLSQNNLLFWSNIKDNNLDEVQQTMSNQEMYNDLRDTDGNNALLLASIYGQQEMVSFLLSNYSTQAAIRNDEGATPLICAVKHGQLGTVKVLLEDDPLTIQSIHAMDCHGNTAALYACATGHFNILQLMIKSMQTKHLLNDVNPLTEDTAIHMAVRNRHASFDFLLFVMNQVSPWLKAKRNKNEDTFYHVCSHVQFLKHQLQHHYATDQWMIHDTPNRNNLLPAMVWAADGRLDLVELVLPKLSKRDVMHVDNQGRTLLHLIATCIGRKKFVSFGDNSLEFIVEKLKGSIYFKDWTHGYTPLHFACKTIPPSKDTLADSTAFIKALVKYKAVVDAVNFKDETPLQICKAPELIDCTEETMLKTNALLNQTTKCGIYQYTWVVTRPIVKTDLNKPTEIDYVIKSGQIGKPETMQTVRRNLQDFLFLRSELLYEVPEIVLPSLEDMIDPLWVDLKPPPFSVIDATLGRLQGFMEWALYHPSIRHHDLVLSFVRSSSNLQHTTIKNRSFSKRKLLLEKINDTIPLVANSVGSIMSSKSETYFLKHIEETVLSMKEHSSKMLSSARRVYVLGQELERSAMSFEDNIIDLHDISETHHIGTLAKETIQVCANITYQRSFVSPSTEFIRTVQATNDLLDGILVALQRPFELIQKREHLKKNIESQQDKLRKSKSWHHLFSAKDSKKRIELEKGKMIQNMNELNQTDAQIHQSHKIISDELAHFQYLHPKKMIRAIRMFARSTLDMEKSKLCILDQTLSKWQKPLPPHI
ncbi:hypothetical protein BD560DRAFT_81937 [Blakeslea trispora]|nr:hypothetical protein BD560DRAFT_81937 [Blakeslea trispora]